MNSRKLGEEAGSRRKRVETENACDTVSCQMYIVLDYTRVVQKVLQMLGFHRYKHLILAKFVMLE